jgi:hypothetical protein
VEATQSLRASPCPEHVSRVLLQSAEDGITIFMTWRIWKFACCEGATEPDEDAVVPEDIGGEDAVSSARPQLEATARMASNNGSR